MSSEAKSKWRAIAFAVVATAFACGAPVSAVAQDWLKSPNRDLMVAVNGYELNEAAAKDALGRGADVNWRNNAMGDETMLIMEVKGQQKLEAIKFLLNNGADPNIKDESGRTALSWARQRLPNNRVGREILALLEAASGQAATGTKPAGTTPDDRPAATNKPAAGTRAPADRTPRRSGGAPTAEEIKETLEKSFTAAYQNHFFGVKNIVTFEWIGPITIGAQIVNGRIPKRCYPAKLNVKVTAEDPRDGNRSTVARGTEANIGGFNKTEIFCFSRDGFGEWEYSTYEP